MNKSMFGRPSYYNAVRTDWTREEIAALFDLPFDELVYQAATVHRVHHAVGQIQLCTLLSIKTGGCPEDCGYCSQRRRRPRRGADGDSGWCRWKLRSRLGHARRWRRLLGSELNSRGKLAVEI